jgi:hypothetical protein
MSPFTQLLAAQAALTALLAAGVVRGHVIIQIRRRPEPRKAPSPSGRITPEEGPSHDA